MRDYIQVTDLVDAHQAALAHLRGGEGSPVCNCGYGHGQTVKEVIDVVKWVSGVDFKVVVSPRRPGDPATIVARADRAKSALGWVPRRDNLDDIVRQALDWERRRWSASPKYRELFGPQTIGVAQYNIRDVPDFAGPRTPRVDSGGRP